MTATVVPDRRPDRVERGPWEPHKTGTRTFHRVVSGSLVTGHDHEVPALQAHQDSVEIGKPRHDPLALASHPILQDLDVGAGKVPDVLGRALE